MTAASCPLSWVQCPHKGPIMVESLCYVFQTHLYFMRRCYNQPTVAQPHPSSLLQHIPTLRPSLLPHQARPLCHAQSLRTRLLCRTWLLLSYRWQLSPLHQGLLWDPKTSAWESQWPIGSHIAMSSLSKTHTQCPPMLVAKLEQIRGWCASLIGVKI
jgi:hypothetical protein